MCVDKIDAIKKSLLEIEGDHFVVLATTANINNPDFYIGGIRCGSGYAAANFIFRTTEELNNVVQAFDGLIDAFLVDIEVKNELCDLYDQVNALVKKSHVYHVKPNDMTVIALDMWITLMRSSIVWLNVLVVGAVNLGSKIALKLAERGANVILVGRKIDKITKISDGLSEILRGNGSIKAYVNNELYKLANKVTFNVILGCTPGVPVIDSLLVQNCSVKPLLIDVGNGTFTDDALMHATEHDLELYCLTPYAGFSAWIAAFYYARGQIDCMIRRDLGAGLAVVGPGVIGKYGDVIVNNPNKWDRVIGVCNGKGDLLSGEKAVIYMNKIHSIIND